MSEQELRRRSLLQKPPGRRRSRAGLCHEGTGAGRCTLPRNRPGRSFYPAGFRNERIKTSGAEINAVIGGSGPPAAAVPRRAAFADHLAPDRAGSGEGLHAGAVRPARLRRFEQARRQAGSFQPVQAPHGARRRRGDEASGLQPVPHGRATTAADASDAAWRSIIRIVCTKLAVLDIVPAHYLYSHVTHRFRRRPTSTGSTICGLRRARKTT